jgi:hypothetical protein
MKDALVTDEVVTTEEVVEAVQQTLTSEAATSYMATLKKIKSSKGAIQTNAEYFKFAKEGDASTGVFVGFQTVKFKKPSTNPQEYTTPQDAVKWMVEEGTTDKPLYKFYIQAGAALVNEIKKNGIAPGTVITMTFTGLADDKQTKLFNLAVVGV